MASQGFSSISNALVAVVIAHIASPSGLGAFGIAFGAYTITLMASRAVANSRLIIDTTHAWDNGRLEAEYMAVSLFVAVVGSLSLAVLALTARDMQSDLLWFIALGLPALIVQDYVRGVAFTRETPSIAAGINLVWLMTQLVFLLTQGVLHSDLTERSVLGAWVLGACVSAAIGVRQTGISPNFPLAMLGLRSSWRRSLSLLVDFLTPSVGLYILTFGLALHRGADAVAPLRGGQTSVAPVNVAIMGINPIMVVEARRSAARGLTHILMRTQFIFGSLNVLVLLAGGAIMTSSGLDLGSLVVGKNWTEAQPLVMPVAVDLAGTAMATAAIIVLRRLRYDSEIIRFRVCTAFILIASSSILAVTKDVRIGVLVIAFIQWGVASVAW